MWHLGESNDPFDVQILTTDDKAAHAIDFAEINRSQAVFKAKDRQM